MMTLEQITQRLKELEEERDFLDVQIWEIQQEAKAQNEEVLSIMNKNNPRSERC